MALCNSMFILIDNNFTVYSVKCCLPEHNTSDTHISKNVKMKYMPSYLTKSKEDKDEAIYTIPIQYMWKTEVDKLTLITNDFIPYDRITNKLHNILYADSYKEEKKYYVTNIKICKQYIEWSDNDIPQCDAIYDFIEFRWR